MQEGMGELGGGECREVLTLPSTFPVEEVRPFSSPPHHPSKVATAAAVSTSTTAAVVALVCCCCFPCRSAGWSQLQPLTPRRRRKKSKSGDLDVNENEKGAGEEEPRDRLFHQR